MADNSVNPPWPTDPDEARAEAAKVRADAEAAVQKHMADPVLSALVLVTHQENFRQRASRSKFVEVGRNVGQLAAVIGVGAGFWHISWIAGIATIVAACFGIAIHSAGYSRLEWGNRKAE